MRIDFEDVLAGAVGRIPAFFLFVFSAIWVGCVIGALAWLIGYWDFSSNPLPDLAMLWASPVHLLNLWLIPNIGLLALGITIMMVTENYGFAAWGTVAGVESLFVMIGWDHRWDPTRDVVVAWVAWLILLAMLETGLWLVRHMRMNRWARDLMELNAETRGDMPSAMPTLPVTRHWKTMPA